jgi:ribosome-associated toxin RatA of RatAB toxin-antitoxin module
MPEHATEQTIIDAPPARCYEVALEFERYPQWARDIKEAEVLSRDEQGRPAQVRFRAAAMGHSTTYVLLYDYSDAPQVLRWKLVEGDITRVLDGCYEFLPVEGDPRRTDVRYELEAELVVPLPGFVKRRAEFMIVHTALRDLKARVEGH